MAKPAIVTIDDEVQVLNVIERDLHARYYSDYRILKASSGSEALELLAALRKRNAAVALFLVDQRMPHMTGTEFLAAARKMYPQARSVLLTAYADTQAAIESINEIGLDHYLMKPWDPPEDHLYPVLDEQLANWRSEATLPYDGIRVAGALWSASSHKIKDFLARNRIPFQYLDVENNSEGIQIMQTIEEPAELPMLFFPDGSLLSNPTNRELAEKIGIRTEAEDNHYDLIIIGGGPAGLGAAVYGASEGLKTLLIEKEATGGQAGTSSRIENYLGFPKGISGSNLAKRATDQAIRLGCELLTAREVLSVKLEENYKIIVLDDGTEISCSAMIIATGVTLRELNVPGVKQLHSAGVYYGAALTEAANFRGKHVAVVGGANSAGQGAMWLSRFAKNVSIIVRGSSLNVSMSQYLIDQIEGQKNIELLYNCSVESVKGKTTLEEVYVKNNLSRKVETLSIAALFIFIGGSAHTELVEGIVKRNRKGFIPTGPELRENGKMSEDWPLKRDPFLLETSIPGIFAAGDIRQSSVRRVASAVGEGAMAISQVHQYLKTV